MRLLFFNYSCNCESLEREEGRRRQGGDGRAGGLRSGEGGPSGSEAAQVPELDRGEETGSVIKCAPAATQAGERTARGFAIALSCSECK